MCTATTLSLPITVQTRYTESVNCIIGVPVQDTHSAFYRLHHIFLQTANYFSITLHLHTFMQPMYYNNKTHQVNL
jgi:hypothetical protein